MTDFPDWNLYKSTLPPGFHWWERFLLEDSEIRTWTHLAAASARRAAVLQAHLIRTGTRNLSPENPNDPKARRVFIIQNIKSYPGFLDDHWFEIQLILLNDLKAGDDNFAKRIAKYMKTSNASRDALSDALCSDNDAAFDEAWKGLPSENPGAFGYSDASDRYLVKNWVSTKSLSLPPFCCWTNETLAVHFHQKFPRTAHGKRYFEDRIGALNLIKIPIFIVTGSTRSEEPIVNEPPPAPTPDRIATACASVSVEIFMNAFPDREAARSAALFLLGLDRQNGKLPEALKNHLLRIIQPMPRGRILIQEIPTAEG